MLGAKDLVGRGRTAGVDGVICCEPEGGEICHVAKGALRLRLDFHGKMAHGAMPFQGRNPNRAVASTITALAELEQALQARHPEDQHLGHVWLTTTVLAAGDAAQMNVMPGAASTWLDVRTIPAVDHDELSRRADERRRLRPQREHDIAVDVMVIDDRPPVATAEDDRLVRALWDAHDGDRRKPAAPRRRARRHRRHRDHLAHRHAVGRVRARREVDRPPGGRVRRDRRPRHPRPRLRRGRRPVPARRREDRPAQRPHRRRRRPRRPPPTHDAAAG